MPYIPGVPDGPEETAQPIVAEIQFATLLYRFLFFDWLFADMSRVGSLFDRQCAWQHNREMRRYLPIYLRRWSTFAASAFGLGCAFEHFLQAGVVAAWFFTWCCVSLTGMLVISALWLFLSREEML